MIRIGQGFDVQCHPGATSGAHPEGRKRYAGRGLLLLKRLSESVSFHERGNHVEIVYDWHVSGAAANPGDVAR